MNESRPFRQPNNCAAYERVSLHSVLASARPQVREALPTWRSSAVFERLALFSVIWEGQRSGQGKSRS